MKSERYERGYKTVVNMVGEEGIKATIEQVEQFYPDFAKMIVEFGFGDIYSRPGLNEKQRELLTIAALITQGATSQLPFHIHASLNLGLTPKEIVEAILHCVPYVGFPRAIEAFFVVMEIFKERSVKPE